MVRSSWLLDREGAVREGCEICRFKNLKNSAENIISQPHHQATTNPAYHISNSPPNCSDILALGRSSAPILRGSPLKSVCGKKCPKLGLTDERQLDPLL